MSIKINTITSDANERTFSWGLERIDQESLTFDGVYHTLDCGGEGVNVYLVDTGIDYNHKDLSKQTHSGYDAFGGKGEDELGNGTFLAGIITAIAPKVDIYSCKILDGQLNGSIEGILDVIDWIKENAKKPAVVNVAIGIMQHEVLDQKIRDSIESGIVYVIEGGADSSDVSGSSPSRVREGIIVGASDCEDSMASFSNYGEGLDIFAPGVDIVSSAMKGGITTMSGVQVAAAHVTGVVALYLGQHPELSPAQVKERIIHDAVDGVIKNVPEGTPNRLLQTYRQAE